MLITKRVIDKMNTVGLSMSNETFVYSYKGKHRSDLKESQKSVASTEIMDKSNMNLKEYVK